MKRALYFLIALFSFLLAASVSASAEGYVFTLKDNFPLPYSRTSSYRAINAEHGVYSAASLDDISFLIENDLIEYIEEDITYTLFDDILPSYNDKYFNEQYYLEQINVFPAWRRGIYGNGVKIAVIDSGFSSSASDYTIGKIHKVEDYTDTASSKNTFAEDENGHGSAVIGIIAAEHNERGIAGIAPESDIYVFKCFDAKRNGLNSDLVAAIYSAVDNYGCDIINMSFGGTDSSVFKAAVDYAAEKGVLLVAAAGNDGGSDRLYYPASYDNVISVGSTAKNGHRASHSQRNDLVNLMAPGENIYSFTHNFYGSNTGTSFAAPQVTAAAALAKSLAPDIEGKELKELLYRAANEMVDRYSGHGLLNIENITHLVDLYVSASNDTGTLYYLENENNVFCSLIPPEGFDSYFAKYDDMALTDVSSSPFWKISHSDAANMRVFMWEKGSLSPSVIQAKHYK